MGAGASGRRKSPHLGPVRRPLEEGADGGSPQGGPNAPRSRGSLVSDDTLICQESNDHGTRRQILDNRDPVDEGTIGDSSSSPEPSTTSDPSVNEIQLSKVRHCLAILEENLHVSFSLLSGVQVITYRQGGEVLRRGGKARGIYVVDEGALTVLSPTGDVVINRLLSGEFCGELSTFFGVLCTATVLAECRATLLWLPYDIIKETMRGGPKRREQLLQWCVKRSYVDTSQIFSSGVLLQHVIANCLKASLFGNLSKDAINFLSKLATPILFSDGDVLYSPGEEPCHLFFVLRGAVECSIGDQVSSIKDIKSCEEGYCIGSEELSRHQRMQHLPTDFFQGNKLKRTSKMRAMGPLLIVPVSGELLEQVANKYPKDLAKFKNYYS